MTKKHVMITINPEIYGKAKKIAGLIRFSTYVENLVALNIQQVEAFKKKLEGGR